MRDDCRKWQGETIMNKSSIVRTACTVILIAMFFALPSVAHAEPLSASDPLEPQKLAAQKTVKSHAFNGTTTCKIKANYPHDSSHVGGTVNATLTVSCSGPKPKRIAITNRLDRINGTHKYGTTVAKKTGTAQSNAALPCKKAKYQNSGVVSITFQAASAPNQSNVELASPVKGLGCTGAQVAANS